MTGLEAGDLVIVRPRRSMDNRHLGSSDEERIVGIVVYVKPNSFIRRFRIYYVLTMEGVMAYTDLGIKLIDENG